MTMSHGVIVETARNKETNEVRAKAHCADCTWVSVLGRVADVRELAKEHEWRTI